MKKTKNPTRRDRLLSKKSIFRIKHVFTIQKEKIDVPCKFKHFSSRTGQRKFFLWKFFSGKGNARTVFLRSIEKINFGKPIPSGIDGKRCDIIRFVHSASFPPVLYHDFFNTPSLPADFFPKLCRSRLIFFCFRRNIFTPGFPRLRRQHFLPVAKSVYIVREKREKADYHG